MSKNNVIRPEGRETIEDPVTELLRVGAQQLIQRAVEADLVDWPNYYPSTTIDEPRRATPGWCATVICLNASYRPAWGR